MVSAGRGECDGLAVWRRCRRHHARHLTGVPVHSAPLAGCSPRRGRRASARRLSPGMCVRRPPGRTLPPGMRVRPLRLPLSPAARGAPRLSLPSVQSCVWPSLPPCAVDPPRRVVALRSCRVHWVIAVRGPRGRSGRGDSTSGDVERHTNLLPRVVDPPRRVVALRSWRVHWVFAVRGPRGRSRRGDSAAGDVERHSMASNCGPFCIDRRLCHGIPVGLFWPASASIYRRL